MEILEISKTKKQANITLDAGELIILCNIFHEMTKNTEYDKRITFYKMYDKFMMLNDLVQYGHLDAFRIEKMLECREKIHELASEAK